MECMKHTKDNIKAYMITALYNAPATMNHYYQQEVQHDMYACGKELHMSGKKYEYIGKREIYRRAQNVLHDIELPELKELAYSQFEGCEFIRLPG